MKSGLLTMLCLSTFLGAGFAATAVPVTVTKPASHTAGKTYPDQSTVALKTPFTTASATAAKGAIGAKDLAGAQKLVGKSGAFQGTVSTVYSPKGHDVVILDFDRDYKQALTAIARPSSYAKLPALAMLKDKHVLVSGRFKEYKGKPEIEITSAGQIRLLP
jgi:hypothetical protein